MTLIHLSPNDGPSTDTELFLSELSSSPDQNATIQFSHQRFVPSDSLIPESGDHHPEIAPFLDVEQSPVSPPIIKRSLGRSKASFASLAPSRQGSYSNILYPHRDSESITDCASTFSDVSLRERGSSVDLRKGVKMIFADMLKLKKSRSRTRFSSDTGSTSHKSSMASLSTENFTYMTPVSSSPPPPPVLKKDKDKKEKEKTRQRGRIPPNAARTSPVQQPLSLDDKDWQVDFVMGDLDQMDGIVKLPSSKDVEPSNGSTSSVVESSTASTFGSSLQSLPSLHLSSDVIFNNPHPFSSTSPINKRNGVGDIRKVSPKSLSPLMAQEDADPSRLKVDETPLWTAPESWAVEKDGEEEPDPGGHSSSEESTNINTRYTDATSSLNSSDPNSRRKSRRKTIHSRKIPPKSNTDRVRVRIYRADGSYHVAPISIHSTVAELTPSLNQKLRAHQERETHKLYLKERGRERVLAPTERPAAIVIRRLQQAGYDQADSLAFLGAEDMTFLLKFVYKSQLLGPAAEDLTFDEFEIIDLTGCSLPTIPIVLYQNAGSIVYLNLSRNPMVEIPLDFIQSCTTLRDLRLSSMAMKKVPQSVRYSTSLHRLDLSCNRIVDLDEAGLDRIPELSTLRLQNNRIEQLPWYFPRLKFLKFLNISNNKFAHVPEVICLLPCLEELDMSFNTITELPKDIGRLTALEHLIFVGNQVSKLPEECGNLINLRLLDCRRNNISDISIAYTLPKLEELYADHNSVHAIHLSLGPKVSVLDASHNDITFLTASPQVSHALTSLDVSYAKLSSLDTFDFSQLPSLEALHLDHNELRTLPDSLGKLSHLRCLSCCDNKLVSLPSTIGLLQRLETLDAHNNSLTELPVSLWNCSSLMHINVTSNLLATWHDPPGDNLIAPAPSGIILEISSVSLSPSRPSHMARKPSNATLVPNSPGRPLPPLAYSLERLSIGENRLTDEAIAPFTILRELRVLNLSFNEIQELPSSFLRNLHKLEELYLSGNQLTSIPTEDLVKMTRLSILFLNGNKFQTLPAELGKIPSLTIIDAGSNLLRYNIHNWEFDWNWNFNCNLKYLNLSGNKKLDLKQNNGGKRVVDEHGRVLSDFSQLSQLRVLGLMDVMTTFLPNIPEETDERRVRTSQTEVNGMSYGIADTIGRNGYLTTLDLVVPEFGGKKDEALFAMFGLAQASLGNNVLSRYLHDNFASFFNDQLLQVKKSDQKGEQKEGVPDALRRTFLKLNRQLHDKLYSPSRKMSQVSGTTASSQFDPSHSHLRQGASGIVVYVVARTLYVANVGHALAVISSQGNAELISKKHEPYDRDEARRIRLAEGWISPQGRIHDEVDTSRAFGYYHDFPVVNARPDIYVRQLTELDEFVIIGNHGLWKYISYQTAVDIARSEASDPMIAAQKLRDFAISYGADGNTMIMVICVADLFRCKQSITDSLMDPEVYSSIKKRGGKKADIVDRTIARLEGEVSPPTGHLCLVFTDIRNSTQLWEANAGMPTAMRLHNNLLRRHLRYCGGYVVKTEGDAFMCSFPTTLAAMWWCLIVQLQLLRESWPLEILECDEGKEVYDDRGNLVARGLSVRMGVHCGTPVCEPDPITGRMDYFGPMVIRAARISGSALGGQIMCSAAVVREINARIFETGPDTEYSECQPTQAIEAIRQMHIAVHPAGEIKLKGLEIPEMVSLVYPAALLGRQDLVGSGSSLSTSTSTARVQLSIAQVRELAVLCLRFEALASSRVFRPRLDGNESAADFSSELPSDEDVLEPSSIMHGDPNLLLPLMNEKTSDLEIMMHLDSLSLRLENAATSLALRTLANQSSAIMTALEGQEGIDERTLHVLASLLSSH